MNVVLADIGGRVSESLYEDVMGAACDLRGFLRTGYPGGRLTTDECLSYVRVTGTLTAKVISMVCWACAYRALQGHDIEDGSFRDLVECLRDSHPVGAGVPREADYDSMVDLEGLRGRIDSIEARIHRLDPVGLSAGS